MRTFQHNYIVQNNPNLRPIILYGEDHESYDITDFYSIAILHITKINL